MKSLLFRLIPVALATSLIAGCEQDPTLVPCGQSISVHLRPAMSFPRAKLKAGQECAWALHVGQTPVQEGTTTRFVDVDAVVDIRVEVEFPEENVTPEFVHVTLDGVAQREPGWVGAFNLHTGEHALRFTSEQDVELRFILRSEGPAPTVVTTDRSLEWLGSNPVIATPTLVGLKRLMGMIADDGHGGLLLEQWLSSFESSTGPSRSGPVALLEQLRSDFGSDASQWDLDALPFSVSSVQNRIDLRDATTCGQLRVVMTATDPAFNNEAMNLNFLFKQPPQPLDFTPAGSLSCSFSALRWVRLSQSSQDPVAWLDVLYTQLEGILVGSNFLRVQTSERIGAETDYEFREWVLAPNPDANTAAQLPRILVNPPMFQAVDTQRLNQAGAERDAFIDFVTASAEGLDAQTVVLPEAYLAVATRADGATWVPLDLTGVPTATLEALPQLRQQIEMVGCTGCHTSNTQDKPVHSRSNTSHSSFLLEELSAREQALLDLAVGVPQPQHYGPLQTNPVLPP